LPHLGEVRRNLRPAAAQGALGVALGALTPANISAWHAACVIKGARRTHRHYCIAAPAQHRHRVLAKGMTMLHYAVVFFVIALIAALFGFGGIAAGAAEIAKVLFFIFLVLFIVSLVLGLFRRSP
jgi:uncharacterized membrane protein YtjA (UPF0391 family)